MNILDATLDALRMLLSADPVLWRIIWISLNTTIVALFIAAVPAILGGYLLATKQFRGRRVLIGLAQASLSIPTVVVGLLLYLILSRQGIAGSLQWLFTQNGLIAGQVLIALPILLAFTMAAIQAADRRIAETAVTLGASPLRVMLTVLHETRFGVMAAVMTGFGRVISEVGCAMMVGGNIAGETRTITTAIALETSKGEFAQGIALGLVLILLALLINAVLMLLQGDTQIAEASR